MWNTVALSLVLAALAPSADAVRVSPAAIDERGIRTHAVESPYQSGPTEIRVLLPGRPAPPGGYPAVYALPVEAGRAARYGDGLAEIERLKLHHRHAAAFIAPTFSHLPWYADHPTDPRIRQETYLLKVVVPSVEAAYPLRAEPRGRLLLGFSKSGYGAWVLLLRHPQLFGSAAAWDAPLALARPGPYGSGAIFGTPENFASYHLTRLLDERAAALAGDPRLILLGYGGFRADHQAIHARLDQLRAAHHYRDGPERKHDWHSGWVAEAVELLLADPPAAAPEAQRD
jgi:S-formylglutathione hydrolase FrmB